VSYAVTKTRPATRPAREAATLLNDLSIPWIYGPKPGERPDFQLWPHGKRPFWLETRPLEGQDNMAEVVDKLSTLRKERADAVLLLWFVDVFTDDKGTLLINVPHKSGDKWIYRAPMDFFITAAPVLNYVPATIQASMPNESWWRRLLRWPRR
jgi:hypothetical protein